MVATGLMIAIIPVIAGLRFLLRDDDPGDDRGGGALMATVAITALTKLYEAGDEPAVKDLSLTVADGEFMVLLGPSGCGKILGPAHGRRP